MSQLYLFTGENIYALLEERRRWVREFVRKHGEENCTEVEGRHVSYRELLDLVSASPFIAEKRLVVIDGIPKMEKGNVDQLLETIHPQGLVLITDSKPDKRLTATKDLLKKAQVQTFAVLSEPKLIEWLKQEAKLHGSSLSSEGAQSMMRSIGKDQMLLASELQKIATFALGREITAKDIEELAMLSTEQAAWKLMDLLSAGKGSEALVFTKQTLERGEDPYALWNMLLWIVAQIALTYAALEEGESTPGSIAKSTGVPPQTASALLPLCKRMKHADLKKLVQGFADADLGLKTGSFKATTGEPQELLALIETKIAALC